MVVGGGPGCFEQQSAKIVRLDHHKAISERE